jgi:hypothetical protein
MHEKCTETLCRYSCIFSVTAARFWPKLRSVHKSEIWNFMKIRSSVVELLHADGLTTVTIRVGRNLHISLRTAHKLTRYLVTYPIRVNRTYNNIKKDVLCFSKKSMLDFILCQKSSVSTHWPLRHAWVWPFLSTTQKRKSVISERKKGTEERTSWENEMYFYLTNYSHISTTNLTILVLKVQCSATWRRVFWHFACWPYLWPWRCR